MNPKKTNENDRRVLIVDDDRDDLAILVDAFRNLSEGRWQIDAVDSVGEALQISKQGKIQLVILAVNTPVLDVPLLLNSFSQSSFDQLQFKLKKVVMTSMATDEKRAASLAAGADMFIEKPLSPEGLKVAFAHISKLAGWELPQNFENGGHSVALADLIQMECLARNSSVLELFHEQSLGRIYIEEGRIIHAVCGELSGERAFQRLFSLTGTFELHDFELPPERTINRTSEALLSAAARQLDSLREHSGTGKLSGDAGHHPGEPAYQAEELFICDSSGKVLYQWQCPDAAGRVTLMQNVARHAEKIIPEIQLGKLDRLEIQLPEGRAVLQPRADRMIFVRLGNRTLKP